MHTLLYLLTYGILLQDPQNAPMNRPDAVSAAAGATKRSCNSWAPFLPLLEPNILLNRALMPLCLLTLLTYLLYSLTY